MREREKRIKKKKARFLPPSCGFDYLIPKQPQENETTPRPPGTAKTCNACGPTTTTTGAEPLPVCLPAGTERARDRERDCA